MRCFQSSFLHRCWWQLLGIHKGRGGRSSCQPSRFPLSTPPAVPRPFASALSLRVGSSYHHHQNTTPGRTKKRGSRLYMQYQVLSVHSSVVVIELRCDYNYLWLKFQLLPITVTQVLRQLMIMITGKMCRIHQFHYVFTCSQFTLHVNSGFMIILESKL